MHDVLRLLRRFCNYKAKNDNLVGTQVVSRITAYVVENMKERLGTHFIPRLVPISHSDGSCWRVDMSGTQATEPRIHRRQGKARQVRGGRTVVNRAAALTRRQCH